MNNFLALGAFAACGWVASNVVLPEPTARPVASRSTTIAAPAFTSETFADRHVLEARRAPVPLVRTVRLSAVTPIAVDAPTLRRTRKLRMNRRSKKIWTRKPPRQQWKRTDTSGQP